MQGDGGKFLHPRVRHRGLGEVETIEFEAGESLQHRVIDLFLAVEKMEKSVNGPAGKSLAALISIPFPSLGLSMNAACPPATAPTRRPRSLPGTIGVLKPGTRQNGAAPCGI